MTCTMGEEDGIGVPSRRTRIIALLTFLPVLLLVVTTASTTVDPGVAGAVTRGVPPLQPPTASTAIDVTSVSPWVPADGDFRIAMRVTGDVPADATVRTSIHQRLRPSRRGTLRSALADVLQDGTLPSLLQAPTTRPISELGNPAAGVVIDIPVRSGRSPSDARVLLPTEGIHPVTVEVLSASGSKLADTTVFLNHLPPSVTPGSEQMPVSLQAVVDGPASISPRGSSRLSPDARRSLASLASLLTTSPSAPLTVAIRPTLLTALGRSTDPTDRQILQALRDAGNAAGRAFVVARMPYVAIDTGGIVATTGGDAEALRQVALGDDAIRTVLGTEPVVTTWLGDPTVTTQSLGVLQSFGAQRLVIGADRLRSTQRGADPELTSTHTQRLNPSAQTVIAPDAKVAHLLSDGDVGPGLRSNQATTTLMATWFDSIAGGATGPDPSEVVAIPVDAGAEVLQSFLPAFAPGGPFAADPTVLPHAAQGADGRPMTAELLPRSSPDQGPALRGVLESRHLIDGYRSLAPAAGSNLAEWELLNAQTLDRSMGTGVRDSYHRRISASITRLTGRIGMPQERRVVLTSRNQTIPLRFRNGLPYDVTVVLRIRSGRLDVGGAAERTVVLHPGQNLIDVPVTTRAPGATLLRVDASSPDGTLVLSSVAIPVTSSTISGVGAALSVLSLLVLGGWWLTSARRDRRERRRERTARRRHRLEEARDHAEEADAVAPADGELGPSTTDDADSVAPGG